MDFLSVTDGVPGVIAVGQRPVGIIAIGALPLGVIAVGFSAVGGISIACGGAVGIAAAACGGSAGLVSIGCGGVAGLHATGVGFAIGLRASCVGLGLGVLPREPFPRARRDLVPFAQKLADTVPIEKVGEPSCPVGWVAIAPKKRDGRWVLEHHGERIELEPTAREKLERWPGNDPPIRAHLVAEDVSADGSRDYRSAPERRVVLRCDDVELPPEPLTEKARTALLFERLTWIGGLVVKGAILAAALLVAGNVARTRWFDATMTRTGLATWTGRVVATDDETRLPTGSPCWVKISLRGDGARYAAVQSVKIDCGSETLHRSERTECTVAAGKRDGRTSYAIHCEDFGPSDPDEDRPWQSKLTTDTWHGTIDVAQVVPRPFKVKIALDPESEKLSGEHVLTPQ